MAQWNRNTVPKCEDGTCSDEVLVTVEKYCIGTYRRVLRAVFETTPRFEDYLAN